MSEGLGRRRNRARLRREKKEDLKENQTMASMSFSMPKSAVDQLKGFISLCKSKPEIIHNEELQFFRDYLTSMGATLPPKPEKNLTGQKNQNTRLVVFC